MGLEESKGATCASSNPQKVGSITGNLKGGGIFGENVIFLLFTSTCCPDKAVGGDREIQDNSVTRTQESCPLKVD